jgi:hypothetical protein
MSDQLQKPADFIAGTLTSRERICCEAIFTLTINGFRNRFNNRLTGAWFFEQLRHADFFFH